MFVIVFADNVGKMKVIKNVVANGSAILLIHGNFCIDCSNLGSNLMNNFEWSATQLTTNLLIKQKP